MITRARIILAARSLVGTPYGHGGRKPGIAVDCGGVVVCAGDRIGYPYKRIPSSYSKYPDGRTLQAILDTNLDPIDPQVAGPGDVVGFWFSHRDLLQHVGILSDVGIIHAYTRVRRCVETSYEPFWQEKLMRAWAFCGVEPLAAFNPADLRPAPKTNDPRAHFVGGCCD